jgi:hypothetical protein
MQTCTACWCTAVLCRTKRAIVFSCSTRKGRSARTHVL